MNTRACTMVVAAMLLSACASTNKSTTTVIAVTPRAPAAPAAAAPTAATATAAQKPGVPYDPRIAAAAKRAKEMGYHVEARHGEQFYCRTTAPLGSRLTQKECLTADSMAQAVQMTDENQVAQRQGQLCQGGGCIIN
jgi:hypothetical protein